MKNYLKELSPFEDYPKELEYPLLERVRSQTQRNRLPRWYMYELRHFRLREHKWKLIPYKNTARAWKMLNKPFSVPYGLQSKMQKFITSKAEEAKKEDTDSKSKNNQKQDKSNKKK
jgi:hypothetical protein